MQEPQRLHAYRQNYRHLERDPLAQLSPSIDIYRAFAPDSSGVRGRLARRELINQGDVGIKGFELLSHRVYGAILLPSQHSRSEAEGQRASAVCSAAYFHGLIFARLAADREFRPPVRA